MGVGLTVGLWACTTDSKDETTDSDGDGIPDSVEMGADSANPPDTDKDGTPDYLDKDSDGDGIPDSVEAGDDPLNPRDTDKDGTPDYLDKDSDGDGIPDSEEGTKDSDGDGIPDYMDSDDNTGADADSDADADADTDTDGDTDSDTDGDTDADTDGDNDTDADSDGGTDTDGGSPCNTVSNDASWVDAMQVAADKPTFTGGTIVPGTYYLTAITIYTGAGGATGPNGAGMKLTSVIGSNTVETVANRNGSDFRANSTWSTSGNQFVTTGTCGELGDWSRDYTATSSSVVRYADSIGWGAYTFTRMTAGASRP